MRGATLQLVIAGLLGAGLVGCDRVRADFGRAPTLTIIWVDASGSAVALRPRMRGWYDELTASDAARPGDVVVVARIEAATYGLARAVTVRLPALDPYAETTQAHRERLDAARHTLAGALDSVLAGPPATGTALLEALRASAHLATAYPDYRLRIVLLTDGVPEGRDLRLRPNRVHPPGIHLGTRLRADGVALPVGTCVVLAGVGTDPRWPPGALEAYWHGLLVGLGVEVGGVGPTLVQRCARASSSSS